VLVGARFARAGHPPGRAGRGAGKTTLLNVIGGLDQPSAGRVWVDGHEVTAAGERELLALRRNTIGFVFQSFGLLPILSAAENIGLPMRLAKLPARRPLGAARHSVSLLARLGLTHGDLSPYNLLVHEGRLVLIDLPQVVDVVANPRGPDLLARDVAVVADWFAAGPARGEP
jgi:ABC-type sugar transport system ATPase subunit